MSNESDRYAKVIAWSEEDQAYIGSCPGLIGPSCHGDTEQDVLQQLSVIVDEWIDILKSEGKELPAATAGIDFNTIANKSVA